MTEIIKDRIAQINRGEIPKGYKKTKAGIMSEEWDCTIQAKHLFKNYSDKKHDGNLEILAATQDRGIVPRSQIDIDIKCSDEGISGYKKVAKGDFVISLRSFQGGIEYSDYNGIVSPAYMVLKNIKPIFGEYYRNYFKMDDFIKRLNGAVYGIRDGKQIGYEDFGELLIHNPPIEEQKKIAEILFQCDKVIRLKEDLIREEQKKKKWLMDKLLNPNSGVRVSEYSGKWFEGVFSDVCRLINGRAYKQNELLASGKYHVLRVGNLFTKSDWYYSDLELHDEKYIDNGDLIYAWSASFGPKIWNGGKVIYHYHIWKVIPYVNIVKEYLYQYFLYDVSLLVKEQQGGTMAHITKETMEKRICRYPELEEQKKIAKILGTVDEKIQKLESELEFWKQKKKALMQLLLTGIVRVKV